jgi:ABC-type Fe3+-hydroxamate transport system substrate-binding protein
VTTASDLTRREFLAFVAAGAALAACGAPGEEPAAEPRTRTFIDVTGEGVRVPNRAARIVATNDQNAGAQLLSLEAPVVGIASRDGVMDPSITAYFDVDDVALVGEHFEPNVEAIAALRPDLIVHEGYEGEITLEPGTLAQLRALAPVVGIDTFRPIEDSMGDIARLLGPGATALLDQQQAAFASVLTELEAVLGERWHEVTASLFITNGDVLEAWAPDALEPGDILSRVGVSWVPLMVEAGLPANGGYLQDISLERIPEFSADLLLVDTAFGGGRILRNPLFEALPAARVGQVIELDSRLAAGHYPGYLAIARELIERVGAMDLRTDLVGPEVAA